MKPTSLTRPIRMQKMKSDASGSSVRKVPMRTCCGCRESFPKKELIRIVRTSDGTAQVDLKGKANGRGAYICKNVSCLEKARKTGSLERSLGIKISQEIFDRLKTELEENEV